MANPEALEAKRKLLRKSLKAAADKFSPESLQPPKLPSWFTNRDVSNGKLKCDPNKIAPTVVRMATETVFLSEHLRSVTVLEEDKIIEASGNASELKQNWQKPYCLNAGGVIRENNNGNSGPKNNNVPNNNNDFSDPIKIGETITAWKNEGMIINPEKVIFEKKPDQTHLQKARYFNKDKYKKISGKGR